MKITFSLFWIAITAITLMVADACCPTPTPSADESFCDGGFDTPIYTADSSFVEVIVQINSSFKEEGIDLFGDTDTLYRCIPIIGDDSLGNSQIQQLVDLGWEHTSPLKCISHPELTIDTLLIGKAHIWNTILGEVNDFFFDDTTFYFDGIFAVDTCECAEKIFLMHAQVPQGVDINNGIAKGSSQTRENGGGAVDAAGFNYRLSLQPYNNELLDSLANASIQQIDCNQLYGMETGNDSILAGNCDTVGFYPFNSLSTKNVKVAVIDTGVDPSYNYMGQNGFWSINSAFTLTQELMPPLQYSLIGTPTQYGDQWPGDLADQNSNCLKNDYYGYDFFHSDNNPADKKGHGTHLAYTVLTADHVTTQDVRVMPLQFGGFKNQTAEFSCNLFAGICAINYAVQQEVDIINLSWGYYSDIFHDLLYAQLLKARDADILVTASAGNDSVSVDDCWHWPSMFSTDVDLNDNLISVTAIDTFPSGASRNFNLASFANFGTAIDIAAPGVSISGALAGSKSRVVPLDGTSMATAIISREAAILRYYNNNKQSAASIKQILLSNAIPARLNNTGTIPVTGTLLTPHLLQAIDYQ